MIVLKKWKCPRPEDEQDWFEIPLERAIEILENNDKTIEIANPNPGLSWTWREGTVEQMLEDGYKLSSLSAIYKKKDS